MLRRDFSLFCRCLIASLVLLAAAALIAALAAAAASESGSYQKPIVAVADEEDSVMSRVLVHTIRNTDAVSLLFDTVTMSGEEAEQAMRDRTIAASVILPPDFTDAVLSGTPSRGRMELAPSLSSQKKLIEAAAKGGELLLLSGQAGIFAGEKLLDQNGVPADSSARIGWLNQTNAALLDEALGSNERYFRTEKLGYADTGMDELGFVALVWLASFLILSGVGWLPLFLTDAEPALLSRMRALGVTWERVLFWKLLLTFSARLLVVSAALFFMNEYGLVDADLGAAGWLLLGILISTIASACLSMCFGNGTVALTAAAGIGLFSLGGITARQLIPRAIRIFGRFSPVGSILSMLSPAFGGNPPAVSDVLVGLFWTVLSLFLLRMRITRLMRGRGDA